MVKVIAQRKYMKGDILLMEIFEMLFYSVLELKYGLHINFIFNLQTEENMKSIYLQNRLKIFSVS